MKELHYAAGLIDGEGTITLGHEHRESRFRYPIVSCSSTTYDILLFLTNAYGGHICKHKKQKKYYKQSYSWKITRSSAIDFCKKIYPILLEPSKSYRAKLIAEEYKHLTPRNGKYSVEQAKAKLDFEDRFFHPSTP